MFAKIYLVFRENEKNRQNRRSFEVAVIGVKAIPKNYIFIIEELPMIRQKDFESDVLTLRTPQGTTFHAIFSGKDMLGK